jgi:hypothetical protein
MSKRVKTGGGSRKGIPNKSTTDARAAIATFVQGNAHRLEEWLNAVSSGSAEHDIPPNPAKAFELFQSVVEYHIPKLARTEHTGDGGGAIEQRWVVELKRADAEPPAT